VLPANIHCTAAERGKTEAPVSLQPPFWSPTVHSALRGSTSAHFPTSFSSISGLCISTSLQIGAFMCTVAQVPL
ncbi:hypothetical protein U1Q18_044691, partial [Sarracenia purpurea var. burkii]